MTVDRNVAPQPGPPRPYHFPRVARRTLDNGLRLLVAENHNAPLVSVRSLVRSGADYDTPELAGLASLTAALLDEGAGTRDAVLLAEDLGLLGASLGSGADWDASYISVDSLSRTFAEAFAIFADVNRRPMLPQASLERVQSERLMELIQQRNEPASIAGKRFSISSTAAAPTATPSSAIPSRSRGSRSMTCAATSPRTTFPTTARS